MKSYSDSLGDFDLVGKGSVACLILLTDCPKKVKIWCDIIVSKNIRKVR